MMNMEKNKRNKRKKTINQLFESHQFRSILVLSLSFGKKNGLNLLHYRWALIRNHDGIKDPTAVKMMNSCFSLKNFCSSIESIKLYEQYGFSNALDLFLVDKTIVKNCFESETNLCNFLTKLIENYKEYHLLKRDPSKNGFIYKPTQALEEKYFRWKLIRKIEKIPYEHLGKIDNLMDDYLKSNLIDDEDKPNWDLLYRVISPIP